jgi:VCBS repeat-containing protein
VEWHGFDYQPRLCIRSPQGAPQATLVYSGVALQHGIRGGFGVLGNAEAARILFNVDGHEAPPVDLVAGQRDWQRFEVPIPDLGVPETDHVVTVTVSGRNVCFDAVAF